MKKEKDEEAEAGSLPPTPIPEIHDDDDEFDHINLELTSNEAEPSVVEEVPRESLGFEEQEGLLPGEIYYDKDRPHWEERHGCILAMVGFAVGLSNVYRFSYLCFKHGGLAFIIPYLFFVLAFAVPLLYLEVLVGQFTQSGMIRAWIRLVPILKGVGWCQCLLPLLIAFYNSAFLAWALHFLVMSLATNPLPWIGCDDEWNTLDCRDIPPDFEPVNITATQLRAGAEYFRGRVQQRWRSKYAGDPDKNFTRHITHNDEYGLGNENTLGLSFPSGEMMLYFVVVFVILYYFMYSGLRFGGKLIWFTVGGPFVILIILIYRGAALPGATSGLVHLLSFPSQSWQNMGRIKTWVAAAEQVVFSLGTGGGIHLTLASYNRFSNNIYRDALATVVIDTGTSFLCSIIVFIALGSIATSDGSDMKELLAQGPDLLFEVCTDFWARLPGGGFFTCIFFLMIFLIGFECLVEALTCSKEALFEACGPWFDKNGKTRWVFVNTMMVLVLVMGILCLARGGLHVFIALDTFTAGVPFILCSLLLVIGMTWFWGLTELCKAADAMTGKHPNALMQITWKYFLPIAITAVLVLQIIGGVEASYHNRNDRIVFKPAIQTLGKVYAYSPIIVILVGIIAHMVSGWDGVAWKTRFLIGISPNYTHKKILETGTGARSKASHYFYCYDRVEKPAKRKRSTLIKVHPEKENEKRSTFHIHHEDSDHDLIKAQFEKAVNTPVRENPPSLPV